MADFLVRKYNRVWIDYRVKAETEAEAIETANRVECEKIDYGCDVVDVIKPIVKRAGENAIRDWLNGDLADLWKSNKPDQTKEPTDGN